MHRRANLILISLFTTLVLTRGYLYFYPNTNLDIAGYNLHHFYSGFWLVVVAGLRLILSAKTSILNDAHALVFGCGLSLCLDEWLYLVATSGSDNDYFLPVSWLGALAAVIIVSLYILWLKSFNHKDD